MSLNSTESAEHSRMLEQNLFCCFPHQLVIKQVLKVSTTDGHGSRNRGEKKKKETQIRK